MTPDTAACESKRRRRPLDQRIMAMVGNEWCGNDCPPLDHRSLYVKEDGVTRVFATTNDGFEVGIGYPDHWHVIMRRESARMFAWWVFVTWVRDWFGLRTKLYYAALHHRVRGEWKWTPHKHARTVHRSSHEWFADREAVDG